MTLPALVLLLSLAPAQNGPAVKTTSTHASLHVDGEDYLLLKKGTPLKFQLKNTTAGQLQLDVVRLGTAAETRGKSKLVVRLGSAKKTIRVKPPLEASRHITGDAKLASYPVRHRFRFRKKTRGKITLLSGGPVGVRLTLSKKRSGPNLALAPLKKKRKSGRKRSDHHPSTAAKKAPAKKAPEPADKGAQSAPTTPPPGKGVPSKAPPSTTPPVTTPPVTTPPVTTPPVTTPPVTTSEQPPPVVAPHAEPTLPPPPSESPALATGTGSGELGGADLQGKLVPEAVAPAKTTWKLAPIWVNGQGSLLALQPSGGVAPLALGSSLRLEVGLQPGQVSQFLSRFGVALSGDLAAESADSVTGPRGGQASWLTFSGALRVEGTARVFSQSIAGFPVDISVLGGVGAAKAAHRIVAAGHSKIGSTYGATFRLGTQVAVGLGPGALSLMVPLDWAVTAGSGISGYRPLASRLYLGYRLSL